jgi:hypothetical protein
MSEAARARAVIRATVRSAVLFTVLAFGWTACSDSPTAPRNLTTRPAHDVMADSDADGVDDGLDNCPQYPNPGQEDLDGDGVGEPCDPDPADADADQIPDYKDNCPAQYNPDQLDSDQNGVGDACANVIKKKDSDGDSIDDIIDNCPEHPNPTQEDADADGLGDVCDPFPTDPTNLDSDEDGVSDGYERCPGFPDFRNSDGDDMPDGCDPFPFDPTNSDFDHDGLGAHQDNCPGVANPDQIDSDGDGMGDACDLFPADPGNDADGDGRGAESDNCPTTANDNQRDSDHDGIGDACDPTPFPDQDGDGVFDPNDNCPTVMNPAQGDFDGDGIGNECDTDQDGDGIVNLVDNCPKVPNADQRDVDGDGIGDVCDEPNVAPIVTAIRLPSAPVAVGTSVSIGVDFTDPGSSDKHSAVINWEVSSTSTAIALGARSFNGEFTFSQAGVYTVVATVTDNSGASGSRSSTIELPAYIVVYDPAAGFVTGGGWFNSPAGACRTTACSATTTGKATFGFVSKYHHGAATPTGNTEFQFKAGDLRFSTTTYEWLVVAGTRARFKGEGTINGAGRYGFMLTAIDGGQSDQFRIKIWNVDTGAVVYDNKMGSAEDSDDATALDGGNIAIHK